MRKDRNLFIDFDRTIYDTDRLYEEIYAICNMYGLTREMIDSSIDDCFKEPILFDFFQLTKIASEKNQIKNEKMMRKIEYLISAEGEQFVFSDFYPFIKDVRECYEHIVLITYGDVAFQKKKILGSKVAEYFNEVIITDKYKWLHNTLKNKNFVAIDDNPREIANYKKFFKNCTLFEIKRPKTKYYKKHSSQATFQIQKLTDFNSVFKY